MNRKPTVTGLTRRNQIDKWELTNVNVSREGKIIERGKRNEKEGERDGCEWSGGGVRVGDVCS